MNAVTIDLIGDRAVNIGASYKVQIQLCNAPDLTLYTGSCQVRQSSQSAEIALEPTITVLSKDIFELSIAFDAFTSTNQAASYVYDVLFSKTEDRFYAIAGKIQFIKRVTSIN